MPKVTFVHPDGRRETVSGKAGTTVMHLATGNMVEGIIGECGGAAMCATCHVIVDPAFFSTLTKADGIEDDMLDVTASERQPTSRLGCQIVLTDEMDGLIVHLPETQQ